MAKIESTRKAVFEPKKQVEGTILIEANSPIHDVLAKSVRCNINYYYKEESRFIASEQWILLNDKATLFLEECLSNFENIDAMLSGFLLEKFQEESVFGILPEEWIISEETISAKPSKEITGKLE